MPTFTIGKQRVVAGMEWEFVWQKRARELRVMAKAANASHFASLSAKNGMLLGTINLKEKNAPLSLALLLLPVLRKHGENVTAVFELANDEYWFVAIAGNELAVLSDVIGTKNTVHAAIDTFKKMNGTSPVCIAPVNFFTAYEAETLTLDAALKNISFKQKYAARLHPASTHKTNTRIAVIAGACFAVWLGWQHWEQVQADKQTALDRKAYLDAKQNQWAKDHQIIKPWVSQPLPADFLSQCSNVWKSLPLSIAGWRIQSAECGEDSDSHSILMVRYKRGEAGSVGDFAARLPMFYRVTPTFDIPGSASIAQFVLPLPVAKAARQDEALIPSRKALVDLTTYIQRLQATVVIQKQSLSDKAHSVALAYQLYHFTVKTDIPPEHLFAQNFPGVRLTKISLSLAQARMHYAISGEMYVR